MNVRWWHRGGVSVGLVGLLAGALVVTSGPAGAVSPPPVPLALPSSVVGSLAEATAAERVAMLGTGTLGMDLAVPVAAGSGAEVVTASGAVAGVSAVPAGVALAGLAIGFNGANSVMNFFGVPENETGLGSLFGNTGPVATAFIPNTGIVASPAGWAGGVNTVTWSVSQAYAYGWYEGTVSLGFIGGLPVYQQAVSALTPLVFTLTGTMAGSCVNRTGMSSIPGPSISVTETELSDATLRGIGVVGSPSGAWFSVNQACVLTGPNPVTVAYGTSGGVSGALFDHLSLSLTPFGEATQILTWYPVGHPLYQAGSDGNPGRAWETRWTCSGGGGAVLRSATFHESDASFPAFPEASCASGSVSSFGIWELSFGDAAPEHQVYAWSPKQALIDWQNNYPQCSDGHCRLELFRVDPTTQGRISCFATPEACLNWATDPALSGQMQCTYAGAAVALSECNAYVPTFNVATGTEVQTKTGIKPSTDVLTFADPATGEPQPNPNPDPVPVPQPGPDGGVPDGCPPPFSFTLGGIGYWVTKGAECALAWAFVPPGGLVQNEVQQTTDVLSVRPPWSLAAPIGAMFTGITAGWSTGCAEMPDFDPSHHQLRLPCDPPGSDSMVVLRWFITVALVVGTGFSVWHMLVAAIGGQAAD